MPRFDLRRNRSTQVLLVVVLFGASAPLPAQEITGLEAAATMESVLIEAIAKGEKSVVAIARVRRNEQDEPADVDPFGRLQFTPSPPRPGDPDFIPNEYGTGVVIDQHGLIVTNFHLLGENSDLYVTTVDRKVYTARVKAADPRSDLAVLSINAHDLVPIKFGDASTLRKGQIVIALGNPYAIARDGQASASWGIVANLGRKAAPSAPDETHPGGKTTLHQLGTLIQTDAKLNLGTSGGALLNLKGEMVGLTTALAATAGYEQSAGYAIPVDETFRRAIDALKQGREVEYGFLGIRPDNLEQPEILSGKHGGRILEVVEGTPAHRYGLRDNDIVTHVNGIPIHDADQLVLEVGKLPVEANVRLTVERDGRIVPMNVELAKYAVLGRKIVTEPAPAWRGLRVDYPTATKNFQLKVRSGEIDPDGCVVVVEVEEGSPAWEQGLRPEMFLTHVGNSRVSTPKEFLAAAEGKEGPVQLRVITPEVNRPLSTSVRTIPAAPAAQAEPAAR